MTPNRTSFAEQVGRWEPEGKFGFDVETNGREAWEPGARIVGLTIAGYDRERHEPTGMYFPLAHEVGENCEPGLLDDLLTFLTTHPLVPFSAQTEAQWALARWGVRLPIIGDGYIGARLLQLEWFGLKDLVANLLKRPVLRLEDVLGEGHYDFGKVDAASPDVQTYVCDDGINALLVEEACFQRVADAGMTGVYQLEVAAALVMAEQQLRGYLVDEGVLQRTLTREEARVAGLEAAIFEHFGQTFTINSGGKLGRLLNGMGIHSPLRTPTGAESWTQEALERIGDAHPVVRQIREWKSGFSVVNGLKRSPPQPTADGRLHPRWRSIGVNGSSRMYAEKPAITNLPLLVRSAFIVPPGRRWMALGWKRPEVAFLAALSGDTGLTALLMEEDPWQALAVRLGLAAPGMPSGAARGETKIIFREWLLAVGDPESLAQHSGQPVGVATSSAEVLAAAFPALLAYLREVKEYALRTRHVRSWFNRRKKIDGAKSDEEAVRSAISAVSQQSVGTALKVVINRLVAMRDLQALSDIEHLIPLLDILYYTLPLDVPVGSHLTEVARIARLDIGRGLVLQPQFFTGLSWGEMAPITDETAPFARQFADLQLGGASASEAA